MFRMNLRGTENSPNMLNGTPPIFSNNPQVSFRPQIGENSDPFEELLKSEMSDRETVERGEPVSGEKLGVAVEELKAYKVRLAQMSIEQLREERKRVTEEIDEAVRRGDVRTLKRAQRKYDLITQTIREKFNLDVSLARDTSKRADTVAQLKTQPSPSKDEIIKQLQQMDITVPTEQSTPPATTPIQENTYTEPSIYSETNQNYNNSNVQVFSWPTTGVPNPQLNSQVSQSYNPSLSGNVSTFNMNVPGMNSLSSVNPEMGNLLARSAELNALSTMLSMQPGMGFTDPNASNSAWLNMYNLFMSGKLMPQSMAELGVFPALNSAILSSSEDKDGSW